MLDSRVASDRNYNACLTIDLHYSLGSAGASSLQIERAGNGLELKLTILVGTMTGTAQLVADEVADALGRDGVAAEVVVMDGLDAGVFAEGGAFLICTSTYGQGDVPDNAQKLFADLEAKKPDLANVAYGVIALGDRTYAQTFCFGGKRFDALLQSLGARRIGGAMIHDASAGTIPEEEAVRWVGPWLAQFREERDKAA
jgi:MioC protein